jgi:hypothetical protein
MFPFSTLPRELQRHTATFVDGRTGHALALASKSSNRLMETRARIAYRKHRAFRASYLHFTRFLAFWHTFVMGPLPVLLFILFLFAVRAKVDGIVDLSPFVCMSPLFVACLILIAHGWMIRMWLLTPASRSPLTIEHVNSTPSLWLDQHKRFTPYVFGRFEPNESNTFSVLGALALATSMTTPVLITLFSVPPHACILTSGFGFMSMAAVYLYPTLRRDLSSIKREWIMFTILFTPIILLEPCAMMFTVDRYPELMRFNLDLTVAPARQIMEMASKYFPGLIGYYMALCIGFFMAVFIAFDMALHFVPPRGYVFCKHLQNAVYLFLVFLSPFLDAAAIGLTSWSCRYRVMALLILLIVSSIEATTSYRTLTHELQIPLLPKSTDDLFVHATVARVEEEETYNTTTDPLMLERVKRSE